jgi:hypothetical protein
MTTSRLTVIMAVKILIGRVLPVSVAAPCEAFARASTTRTLHGPLKGNSPASAHNRARRKPSHFGSTPGRDTHFEPFVNS